MRGIQHKPKISNGEMNLNVSPEVQDRVSEDLGIPDRYNRRLNPGKEVEMAFRDNWGYYGID